MDKKGLKIAEIFYGLSQACNKIMTWHLENFLTFQFIEKFHEVKEATRTAPKPLNGTTPTTSASASPVAARSAATVVTGGVTTTDNQVGEFSKLGRMFGWPPFFPFF